MKKLKFLTILILPALLTFAFKCNTSDSSDDSGIYKGRLYTDNQLKTPQGASVFSQRAINAELLPLIDAGIKRLNQIASAAPTAKANDFRAVSISALVKTVCIAANPNFSNFGFFIVSSTSVIRENSL